MKSKSSNRAASLASPAFPAALPLPLTRTQRMAIAVDCECDPRLIERILAGEIATKQRTSPKRRRAIAVLKLRGLI